MASMNTTFSIRRSKKRTAIEKLVTAYSNILGLYRFNLRLEVITSSTFFRDHGAEAGINVGDGVVYLCVDSNLSKNDLVTVIAHEMIHVKQVATGQLRYENNVPFWRGKKADHYEYQDRPWERLAYGRTDALICQLAIYLGIQ